MPIALNRACKLTGFFLGHDKEYVGIMRIHEEKTIEEIQEIINENFLGKIKQTPPVKSRVKRQEREREIISFELLEKDGEDVLFKAKVQGGTYIRKLIDDLGKEIGGAHMLELRRTNAGIFSEDDDSFIDLYKLEKIAKSVDLGDNKVVNKKSDDVDRQLNKFELTDNKPWWAGGEEELRKILIPAEEALKKIFPVVQVKEESVKRLLTGKPIMKDDIVAPNQVGLKEGVPSSKEKKDISEEGKEKFIAFCEDKFIGIYRKTNENDIIARAEFVLQEIKK